MSISLVSNYASNVAQNNLRQTTVMANSSIAKLSSGLRVNSAKDDAASLSIGQRLKADVSALRQASTNAGQAGSLLQIADGAYATISNILVRASTIAVQSSSGQLGASQRASLNLEYQNLMQEIDRIAKDTEFNGVNMIKGGTLRTAQVAKDLSPSGLAAFTFSGSATNDGGYRVSYDALTETLTLAQLAQATGHTQVSAAYLATKGIAVEASSTLADDTTFSVSYDGSDTLTITNRSTGTVTTAEITDAWNNTVGAAATVLTGTQKVVIDLNSSAGVKVTLSAGFEKATAVTELANANTLDTATGILAALAAAGTTTTQTAALDDIRSDALKTWQGLSTFSASDMSAKFDLEVRSATSVGIKGVAGIKFGADINNLGASGAGYALNDAAMSTFVIADAAGNLIASIVNMNVDYNPGANPVGTYAGTLKFALGTLSDTVVKTTSTVAAQSQSIDITNLIDGVAGVGQNLGFGQTVDVAFSNLGITVKLDGNFSRATNVSQSLSIDGTGAATYAVIGSWVAANPPAAVQLYDAAQRKDVIDALTAAGLLDKNTGELTLKMVVTDAGAGDVENLRFKGTANIGWSRIDSGGVNLETGFGVNSAVITTAATAATDRMFELRVQTSAGSFRVGRIAFNINDVDAALTAAANNTETSIKIKGFGDGLVINNTNTSATVTTLSFKLGTGVDPLADDFTLSVGAATVEVLGLTGTRIDGADATNANAAITLLQASITKMGDIRANVGAAQNRLDYAVANLSTATENAEAARSAIMDLDVAAEISRFTSLQLLQQAGVSALGQANQLPQSLLRLLQ
jgi:flagellin